MGLLKTLIKSSPPLTRLGRDVQMKLFPGRLEDELRLLPFLVDRTRTAVDVGANVGVYTHALLRLARKVVSVEANPRLADALRTTFGRRITVINAAASREDGEAVLRIPDMGPRGSGLATVAAENALSDRSFTEVTVPARRLSALIDADEPVGFLKIDVEGHELAVLEGGRELIARQRPVILLEAEERHRPDAVRSIVAFLQPLGYGGFMLRDGVLASIDAFDPDGHQRVTAEQAARLDQGERPAYYVNNFVFVPSAPAS